MTRNEFIEEICSWDDLINFCYDNGCDHCDDVFDEEARDELLNERLQDKAKRVDCWQDLLDWLKDISTGFDCYREADYFDFPPLDEDDFNDYKDDVLDWADDNDIWDEEEEADEDEEPPIASNNDEDTDDDFFAGEEPISIGELMSACNSQIQQIIKEEKKKDMAEDECLEALFA